jgi:hypothetical protein
MMEAAHEGGASLTRRAAQGAIRGAVASMAMTGLREFTRHVGLLEELRPRRSGAPCFGPGGAAHSAARRAQAEIAHWTWVAPLLGLPQGRRQRTFDRIALATDHLLYGSLLSENATLRSAARPSSRSTEGAR